MGEGSMQTKLDFLIERVQKQNPQANIKKIRAAYECAAKAHEGQKRRNGEPYIIHPVAVAEIVVFSFCVDKVGDLLDHSSALLDYIGEFRR